MFEIPTNYGKPETHRVKTLYEELYRTSSRVDSQRAVLYTEYMNEHAQEHLYLKTAGASRHVLSHITPVIFDNELLVGSISRYIMGAQVYPELEGKQNIPALEGLKTGASRIRPSRECVVSKEDREKIDKAAQFWLGKDLYTLIEEHCLETGTTCDHPDINKPHKGPQSVLSYIPDEWLVINYQNFLDQGADSIIENIQEFLEVSVCETNPYFNELKAYLNGIICLLEGIVSFAENYAHEAQRQASLCTDSKRKMELTEIARICMKVPRRSPDTFREALQSFWFVHVCMCLEFPQRNASPGRFDQYLNPYFENDLSDGTLSSNEALELLELMRIKCEEIITVYKDKRGTYLYRPVNQYITLAGSDSHGNASDTLLSKFMLQARINIPTEQPVLTVRWREDLSDFFKHKVIDCIKTARWCPDIYHEHIGTKRYSCKPCTPSEKLRDWIVYADNMEPSWNPLETMDLLFRTHHAEIFDILLKYSDFSSKEPSMAEDEIRKKRNQIMVSQYYTLIRQTARIKNPEQGNVFLGPNNTGIVHPCLSTLNISALSSQGATTSLSCRYSTLDRISALSLIDLAKAITVLSAFLSKDALFTLSEIREAIQTDFEGTETMRQKLLGEASLSSQHPLFEETLIDLFDTWALFADKWSESSSVDRSALRRFTLIRGTTARTQSSFS